ncbi:Tom22-domain-containing protein [Annulohypoxylon bovei var. microspora]|nr:Tom22-domain-containing protein [Annulohypoxylon bovei var. microspora]
MGPKLANPGSPGSPANLDAQGPQEDFEEPQLPRVPPNTPVLQAIPEQNIETLELPLAGAMVQLTEVVDEHFQEDQPGPEENDEDYTDTDSEISNESDYDPLDETFTERLYALRDIIPPHTRTSISNTVTATTDAIASVLSFGGRTLWILGTSALILGVPWALAWSEEQQVIEMEKEMKMREMGGELLTAGGDGESLTAQQVNAALGKEAKPAL